MKEDVFKLSKNLREEFKSSPENFKFTEFVAASQSEVFIVVQEGTFNSSKELTKAIEAIKSKHGGNIKILFASSKDVDAIANLAEVVAKFEASVEESIKIRELMHAPEVFLTEKPKHPFQKFIGKPKY
jgi:hypothetical protein